MKALVLEDVLSLSLRDFPIERDEMLGRHDVRIKMHTVGFAALTCITTPMAGSQTLLSARR